MVWDDCRVGSVLTARAPGRSIGIYTAEQTKNAIAFQQWRNWLQGISDSPLDLVRTEASGTSVHMARSTVHDGLAPLHIGLPGSVGTSVGVGDLNTKGNALATIITLRHNCTSYPDSQINMRPNTRLDMIADIAKKSKCFFGNFFVF